MWSIEWGIIELHIYRLSKYEGLGMLPIIMYICQRSMVDLFLRGDDYR